MLSEILFFFEVVQKTDFSKKKKKKTVFMCRYCLFQSTDTSELKDHVENNHGSHRVEEDVLGKESESRQVWILYLLL